LFSVERVEECPIQSIWQNVTGTVMHRCERLATAYLRALTQGDGFLATTCRSALKQETPPVRAGPW
jgi:hypothetical protein